MSKHHNKHGLRGTRYERFRREQLDRAGWRCSKCGRPGRLELDHRVPLEDDGPAWDPANCQVLCRSCHFDKTRKERRQKMPPKSPQVRAWMDFLEELSGH